MALPTIRGPVAIAALMIAPVLAACGSSSSAPTTAGTECAGPTVCATVPNVVGENMDKAAMVVLCAGLRPDPDRVLARVPPSSIAHVVHTVPLVVSMQPPANTSVPRGTAVQLRYLSPPGTSVVVSASCVR